MTMMPMAYTNPTPTTIMHKVHARPIELQEQQQQQAHNDQGSKAPLRPRKRSLTKTRSAPQLPPLQLPGAPTTASQQSSPVSKLAQRRGLRPTSLSLSLPSITDVENDEDTTEECFTAASLDALFEAATESSLASPSRSEPGMDMDLCSDEEVTTHDQQHQQQAGCRIMHDITQHKHSNTGMCTACHHHDHDHDHQHYQEQYEAQLERFFLHQDSVIAAAFESTEND